MTAQERLQSIMESIAILEAKEAQGTATEDDSDTLDDLWSVVLDLERQIENESNEVKIMSRKDGDKNILEQALSRLTMDMWNDGRERPITEEEITKVMNYVSNPEVYTRNIRYAIQCDREANPQRMTSSEIKAWADQYGSNDLP